MSRKIPIVCLASFVFIAASTAAIARPRNQNFNLTGGGNTQNSKTNVNQSSTIIGGKNSTIYGGDMSATVNNNQTIGNGNSAAITTKSAPRKK
jgi:hypothetical protein